MSAEALSLPECPDRPSEGTRVGRFVTFRGPDGRIVAVAAGAVTSVCETDDGAVLVLPGGRLLPVSWPIGTVLSWLSGDVGRPVR